jgi:hypothetical protein
MIGRDRGFCAGKKSGDAGETNELQKGFCVQVILRVVLMEWWSFGVMDCWINGLMQRRE